MEKIIKIIKEINPSAELDAQTKLLENRILDSLSMISLVSELEDEFDIEFSVRDIVPENFETVSAIWTLVNILEDED